jgi:predicted PurR-regulated permease PerM
MVIAEGAQGRGHDLGGRGLGHAHPHPDALAAGGLLVFIVAYRMFQDYFLSPHLMGQGVQLHPLLVLLGVFGGAEVAGVAGSFLSVPVLAMARILYVRTRRSRLSAPLDAHPDTPQLTR